MEAFFLFFRTKLGLGILGAVAVAALLAGSYAMGHSKGYDTGEKAGIKSQQPEINRLAGIINAERKATADKTKAVEKKAAEGAVAAQVTLAAKEVVRIKVVDHYHETEKLVAAQCGLSDASVTAINLLLDTQVVYEAPETPAVSNTPAAPDTPVVPTTQPIPKEQHESDLN